jgi:sphinganine C4-monooxygenase
LKNRVTVKQVIWAVLLQQVIQTALGLAWLEDDDPLTGPFRDHAGDIANYFNFTTSTLLFVLGKNWGSTVVKQHGHALASWMYWWGVPTFQFFFAS